MIGDPGPSPGSDALALVAAGPPASRADVGGGLGPPPRGDEELSSEEDWNIGNQRARAAPEALRQPQQYAALGAPPPGAPLAVEAAPVRRGVGRPRKRPATSSAASGASAVSGPQVPKSEVSAVGKLANYMFGSRDTSRHENQLSSSVGLATATGILPKDIYKEVCGLAHSAYTLATAKLSGLVAATAYGSGLKYVDGVAQLLQPLLFVRWRKYDETPWKLKVQAQLDGDSATLGTVEASVGQHKLLVTEAGWAMCLRKQVSERTQLLSVMGDQPTHLQCIASNTAECLVEALGALKCAHDSVVDERFFRCVDIVMTDACGANLLCERILAEDASRKKRSVLHILCDAHRIAIMQTQFFSLFKPMDTRLIRLALSLDGFGLSVLKRELRALLSEQLVVIVGGRPSVEASRHRNAVWDLYLGDSPKDRRRRTILEGVFNGDIRKPGVVEHYEVGCCSARRHTLQVMLTHGVNALVPKRIPVMARSNWTGSDKVADSVGLPSAVHGLLAAAYIRAFHDAGGGKASASGAAAGHGEGDVAEASGAEGGAVAGDGRVGAAGGASDESKDSRALFQEDIKDRRLSTIAWIRTGRMADDVGLLRVGHKPQSVRMLKQLSVTGEKWELKQQASVVKTGCRKYQIVEAHNGEANADLMSSCTDAMFNPDRWLVLEGPTEHRQTEAFRGLARTSAAAYETLHRRHRWWPFKLFGMLKDPEGVANDLMSTADCLLDNFTLGFKQHYQYDLCGQAALAEIETLAAVCHTDTSSTERWHSRNQRRAKFRVWSHAQDLPSLSAHFLGRRGRAPDRDGPGARGRGGARRSSASRRRSRSPAQRQRAGGGGAWRAFVHVRAQGRQLDGPLATELSLEYRNLDEHSRQHYFELGQLAATAKRQGDRGFGSRLRRKPLVNAYSGHALPAILNDAGEEPAAEHVGLGPISCVAGPARGSAAKSAAEPFSRIVADGARAEADAKDDLAREADELKESMATVNMWVATDGAAAKEQWQLVGGGGGVLPDGGGDFQPVPNRMPIAKYEPKPDALAAEIVQAAAQSTAAHRASQWEAMHQLVKSTPKPRPKPVHRKCHDAGMCICTGDVPRLRAKFHTRLQQAFHASGKHFEPKAFQKMLTSGDMVLHVKQQLPEGVEPHLALVDDGPAVSLVVGGGLGEVWLHVSMHYMRPWRPTFVVLRRSPPLDRPGAIGLEACRRDDDHRSLLVLPVWEVIATMVNLDAIATIEWYKLVSSDRAVLELQPWRQRVARLEVPTYNMWRGASQEKSKKRRLSSKRPSRPKVRRRALAIEDMPRPPQNLEVNSGDSCSDDGLGEHPEADADEEAEDPLLDLALGSDGDSDPAAPETSAEESEASEPMAEDGGELAVDELLSDGSSAAEPEHFDQALEVAAPPPMPSPPPVPPMPPARRAPAGVVQRRPPDAPLEERVLAVHLPENRGVLRRYNSTNTVVMHCPLHPKCRLTRSLCSSQLSDRGGQGRPLGLLLAWVSCCPANVSAEEHVHLIRPSLQDRQEARAWLSQSSDPSVVAMLSQERGRREGEPEEPPHVP